MKLLEALNWRYAVNHFSRDKLSTEKLKTLLEAVRLSPSSYGLQPYKIIVIESPELRRELLPYSFAQDKVLNSSHLLIFAAHTNIGEHTVDNYIEQVALMQQTSNQQLSGFSNQMKQALNSMDDQQKQAWAHQQAYIALGNLLTSAAMMKIDTCPMAGFNQQGYDEVLKLKEQGLTSTVICPVGIRHPDDKQGQRPKVRFPFQQLIMEM